RAGTLKAPVVQAVEVGEDAVLVLEHQRRLDESSIGGFGVTASRTFAGSPGFLAAASLRAGSCLSPPLPRLYRAGSVSVVGPPTGADSCRSTCGPPLTVLPATRSSNILVKLSGLRSS